MMDFLRLMRRLSQDEHGLIGMVGIAILGIVALFTFSMASAVNWTFIIACFAFIILGVAFVGVVFLGANPDMILYAILADVALISIVQVGFITLIGGGVIIVVLWNMKLLKKQPLIFALLMMAGFATMLLGNYACLIPLGIVP